MIKRYFVAFFLLVSSKIVLAEQENDVPSVKPSFIVHGVSPEKQDLYKPLDVNPGMWACLNDSGIVLKISQINDGICDCPDGSDEPGTGACGNVASSFYCRNEGFLPRYIPQSQVNDGVCDCCDCSDELLAFAEPFSRKTDCATLKSSFDKLITEELENHKKGLEALQRIQSSNNLEDPEVVAENLSRQIAILQQDLLATERRLSRVNQEYLEQLKTSNPLLYQFEQIDSDHISEVVNSSFVDIIDMSRAFEELVDILNRLQDSYSRSLNDRVVNSNVRKFGFLKNQKFKNLNIDSKVEEDQRRELLRFFKEELPTAFAEGKIDQAPTYLTGKATFVETLIIKRVEYTETVLNVIKSLRHLMDDIAQNHNVNYQDSAVKHSVELYKNWLAQYTSLEKRTLSERFLKELHDIKEFVTMNSHRILSSGGSSERSAFDANSFGKHWNFLVARVRRKFSTDLKAQIKEHQTAMTKKQEELDSKKLKLTSLKNAGSDDSLIALQELMSSEVNGCFQGVAGSFIYEICPNERVYQRELAPPHRTVNVGNFQGLKIEDEQTRKDKYMEHLKIRYPDQMDLLTELISEQHNVQEYMFGNLYEMSNGLTIRFDGGSKCWNGPNRSATVFFECGETPEIISVYETSRCNYGIEVKAPIGCNAHFSYVPRSIK